MNVINNILKELYGNVVIVSSGDKNKWNGCTVAWYTRVSSSPSLIGVAIAPSRLTSTFISENRSFCLNILSKDQLNIAKELGFKSGRNVNKSSIVDLEECKNTSLYIKGISAFLQCTLIDEFKTGDHIFYVGKPEFGIDFNKDPLKINMSDYKG